MNHRKGFLHKGLGMTNTPLELPDPALLQTGMNQNNNSDGNFGTVAAHLSLMVRVIAIPRGLYGLTSASSSA